jgi:hypothetical protein
VGPEKGKSIVMKVADAAAIWVSREGRLAMVSNGAQILLGCGGGQEAREEARSRTSASCRAN